MVVYRKCISSASCVTWAKLRAVTSMECPRFSSSLMIGAKNGTCGELSRSIHILFWAAFGLAVAFDRGLIFARLVVIDPWLINAIDSCDYHTTTFCNPA